MSQRKISFSSGEFYHIYNRGNSKQIIFHDVNDYDRFMRLLFVANGSVISRNLSTRAKEIFEIDRRKPLVAIGAYCLMPNHFHILLTEIELGGISKFMQKLTTGYSMYYNNKYKRTGALFEGKFKSEHVSDDNYLKYLFSYIHLNPLKLIQTDWKEIGLKDMVKAREYLTAYKYSSHNDFLTVRPEGAILMTSLFPQYFQEKREFENEISEWIQYKKDII